MLKAVTLEWRHTIDSLPERNQEVIVCRTDGTVQCGRYDRDGWWRVFGCRTKQVSHWMPLPDSPEAAQPSTDVQPWIRLCDARPEEGVEVLVCTLAKNGHRDIDKGYRMGERIVHRGSASVTHWMPRPPLPPD